MHKTPAYRQAFEEKLKSLNAAQSRAVRTIDGPVMVIAGPGTGKTTMLSYRIGYILMETDAEPQGILCLTYTEAAATEMRNRLIEYIGPEAYKIQVNTFHGFCNLVIQENPSVFAQARELEPISDIDKFRLFQDMMDSFADDHPLRRFRGQKYFDWKRLVDLFDTMKAENWSPDYMLRQIDAYIELKRADDEYIYKRKSGNFQKGDFKESLFQKDVLDKMIPLQAAVCEFDTYNKMLADAGQYDFQDMLQWVNRAFARDPNLLADYQERFQYVMVDEFQDTNGIQMDILQQLIDHEWLDKPNVFVVGDDDQAIYRFQGANVANLVAFYGKYHPEVIALDANYRSSQIIIDTARVVMEPVRLNLMEEVFGQTKRLTAQGPDKDHEHPVHTAQYPTLTAENADVFRRIKDWYEGKSGDSMAVIYYKHALGSELAQALKGAGIPFSTKLRQNILDLPMIGHVLDILSACDTLAAGAPVDDAQLFRLLHLDYLDLPAADLQRVIIAYTATPYAERNNLFVWMSDPARLQPLGLSQPGRIQDRIMLFDRGAKTCAGSTVQATVEWVVNHFGLIDWIMEQPEKVAPLSALKTLYTFIEEQASGRDAFAVTDLLEICSLMKNYGLQLPAAPLAGEREKGVILSTVHGVKGLEFDRVIIKNMTENEWEKKRAPANKFSLPDNLVITTREVSGQESDYKDEDLRRLLYVGMTRARRQLTLTFSAKNDEGKGLTRSQYVAELLTGRNDIVYDPVNPDDAVLTEYLLAFMRGQQKADLMLDQAEIQQRVREHVLNPSGLNAYLECPLGFYYDKILRVPSITAPHMLFGQALHYALEQYFIRRFNQGDSLTSKEFMLETYERFLFHRRHQFAPKEYQDRVVYGKTVLGQFFDTYSATWSADVNYATEYKIQDIHIDGVPVKGFMDRVDRIGDRINVYDYKSGRQGDIGKKLARPNEENPTGGSYWRQIVFYDLMLLADPRIKRSFDKGIIQGLEPDKNGKFTSRELIVTEDDRDKVRLLIRDTYDKIQAMEFDAGCGKCAWCAMHGIQPALADSNEHGGGEQDG